MLKKKDRFIYHPCNPLFPNPGYTAVEYRPYSECKIPNWTYRRFIIPRLVQEDLFKKISEALNSNNNEKNNIQLDVEIGEFFFDVHL